MPHHAAVAGATVRPMRARVGSIALPACVALASIAAAAPPRASDPLRLDVERTPAAADCPDEARLRAAIVARQQEPASDGRTVSVAFDRRGGVYSAQIVLEGPDGARHSRGLSSPASSCAELADTAALTIALATEVPLEGAVPSASAPMASEAPSVEPVEVAPAPSVAPSVVPMPAVAPAPAPARPLRGVSGTYVGGGVSGAFGAGPPFVFGPDLELGLVSDRIGFAVELHGRFANVAAPTAGSVQAQWGWVSLVPCARAGGLYGCAVVGAGAERVRGAVERPQTSSAAYVVAGVRGGGELPVGGGVSLFAQAELDAPVVRARVDVDGLEVFRAEAVALTGAFGVRVALP